MANTSGVCGSYEDGDICLFYLVAHTLFVLKHRILYLSKKEMNK
jgi:hypothetical protein